MSILLALLIQLVVPALTRKLAVLVGAPTRSKREVITQDFYFTFLFIELVLLTAISSGVVKIIPQIVHNPINVPTILATNIPTSANYFFNYLIIQALSFSGSVLFQYLRVLYISTIWPWFTQTPREEAWLQTTIPHQVDSRTACLLTQKADLDSRCGLTSILSLLILLSLVCHSDIFIYDATKTFLFYQDTSELFYHFKTLTYFSGLIFSVISPLMLIFVSATFALFWVAYRHNYYYVQRNKVDTHGLLFNNAISQLFAGIYVMEIALIGLFLLVRDSQDNVACKSQAIIMIIILILTAVFHFVMEQHLRPLYEFLPVTLEDSAVDAERRLFLTHDDNELSSEETPRTGIDTEMESIAKTDGGLSGRPKSMSVTADHARQALSKLRNETAARVANIQAHLPEPIDRSRRREVADQLAAAIAGFPDELTDLTSEDREAQLKAAFQDPVTREPPPVIWIPQDPAGISEDAIKQARRYGRYLQYSNAGAYLTPQNKCEVTQPAPDTRPDWLLDWVL